MGLDRVTHNGGTSVYTFHQDQVNTMEGSPLNSSAQEYWAPQGQELREVTETGLARCQVSMPSGRGTVGSDHLEWLQQP